MNISHKENESFLRDKLFYILSNDINIEWSNISPYSTEINGITTPFNNSYEAHVKKHPKNPKEEYIWKKQLLDFPNKIEDSYYEYSQKLINKKESISSWFYDEENYSLNKDFIVTLGNNKTSTIRIALKRSHKDYDKIVISTCHPRIKKKYYFNRNNKLRTNYFYNKKIDITNKRNALNYLFFTNETEYNEYLPDIFEILNTYIKNAKSEAEILEEYNKERKVQFTDLYDIDRIKDHIDNIFLYEKFYSENEDFNKFMSSFIFQKNEHSKNLNLEDIYHNWIEGIYRKENRLNIIRKLVKLDNPIAIYLMSNYKRELLKYYDCLVIPEKKYYNQIYSIKKQEHANCLNEIIKKYELEGIIVKTDKWCCKINDSKMSNALNPADNNMLQEKEIYIFCVLNKVSYEDFEKLLRSVCKSIPLDYINSELTKKYKKEFDLKEEWENLFYILFESQEIANKRYDIVDLISKYNQTKNSNNKKKSKNKTT